MATLLKAQPRGTVAIDTHGCKLNQADSEALARRFVQAGYRVVGPQEQADVYIVNTCTVTHVADRKARKSLRGYRHLSSSALVVATGCYAQRAPKELQAMPEVSLVASNTDKARLVDMVLALRGDALVPCATGEDVPVYPGAFGRTRAMVKVQEGCNQVCAYCIVPKVRGRERSVPLDLLVQQVAERVQEGFKEVVLTGTQLGTYGFDLPGVNLVKLVESILVRTSVPRLRISSLQPQEITPALLDIWSEPRLCPHFHMPLQSGSDSVLKRMRRRYTAALYAETVERIRAKLPHATITTDVIVGFPGETDQEFHDTLRLCREMEFASMHLFPYSVRSGTTAAYLKPQVDEVTKAPRMEAMVALEQEMASRFRRRAIGDVRPVLWERVQKRNVGSVVLGLSDNYLKVFTRGDEQLINEITPARFVEEQEEALFAEVQATNFT